MAINTPGTKILPESGLAAPVVDESIPWDELSEGSRDFLDDLRVSLREMREGKTQDAKTAIAELRAELESDAKNG